MLLEVRAEIAHVVAQHGARAGKDDRTAVASDLIAAQQEDAAGRCFHARHGPDSMSSARCECISSR